MPRAANRETRAWLQGYRLASAEYKSIRDCRIFAWAYAQGFVNGLRAAAKPKKGRR